MTADAETWREWIHPARLSAWMDGQGLGFAPLEEIALLGGGTQNILVRFRHGTRNLVLRRPPRHPRMSGNDIMRRESRVLAALADTEVAHPRLVAACLDDRVIGAAFYLMEEVDGFNATAGLPALHAGDAAIRREMGFCFIDAAAALGRVNYQAVGLDDFGKVDGFLERQVGRWKRQLEGYHEYAGWPGPGGLPEIDRVGFWLEANRPSRFLPGILHGDYHLANAMFCYDRPDVAAIIDWELATIGDPLIDLGWVLATWPDPSGHTPVPVSITPWSGFPPEEELLARYAAGSTRDLSAYRWYAVLGCYKLGILQEGTYARAFAGQAPMATGERLHAASVALFERAIRWVDDSGKN